MKKCITGDGQVNQEEFTKLFIPIFNTLNRFALGITRNQKDAEDLTQETYLKAFRSFHLFEPETNPRAWAITIMVNTYRTAYRKMKEERRSTVGYDFLDDNYPAPNPTDSIIISDRSKIGNLEGITTSLKNLMSDETIKALNSISENFRTVILLRDVAQFDYQEISDILGLGMGTVKSRLFRGRRLLRKKIGKSPWKQRNCAEEQSAIA